MVPIHLPPSIHPANFYVRLYIHHLSKGTPTKRFTVSSKRKMIIFYLFVKFTKLSTELHAQQKPFRLSMPGHGH